MLRNVLEDYLQNILERDFDLPFLALLPSMGFYDVHITHSQVEFGKDFIAKKIENGIEIQYSFQSKAGDIDHSTWRNEIRGQMLECVSSGLSHPSFDKNLPHQSILVVTGKLKGNAALGFQDFNNTIKETYKKLPATLWDREILLGYLEQYGLDGVYKATASGYVGYGDFYILYGKSLREYISIHEIEEHSRHWLQLPQHTSKNILAATLEANILIKNCKKNGFIYEAIYLHLSILRTILFEMARGLASKDFLTNLFSQAKKNLLSEYRVLYQELSKAWYENEKSFAAISQGTSNIITYLVSCSRLLEAAGLLYFLEEDPKEQIDILDFISEFIVEEPGCGKALSDNYAVSIIFPTIALIKNQKDEEAIELIQRATIWLCDQKEEGSGIAPFGANPKDEVFQLLGHPFSFIELQKHSGNFFATVILDLAIFVGNKQLYDDVFNDFQAVGIIPQYWLVPDTKSLYCIDGEDIISYPNVEFSDSMGDFSSLDYAEHIKFEARNYKLVEVVGEVGIMLLTLFLRDRYFPTLWKTL